jgi:hypothetical protein
MTEKKENYTKDEYDQIRLWQSVLEDTTRSPGDHEKAKAALEQLNCEGPWAKIRELEARVAELEEYVQARRKCAAAKPKKAQPPKASTVKKRPPIAQPGPKKRSSDDFSF